MTTLNTPTKIKKKLQQVKKKIKDWEVGKILLTGPELKDLQSQANELPKLAKSVCKHRKVVIQKGFWVNHGYGSDMVYDAYNLHCYECDSTLFKDPGYSSTYPNDITEPMALTDAANAYLRYEPHYSAKMEKLLKDINEGKI